jgi:hypothetical protein
VVHVNNCSPSSVLYPESLEEVQKIIKKAHAEKIPLRFIGTGYSWQPLLCTSGYLVSTRNFTRVLAIDTEKQQVRVEAGITLNDLQRELAKHNLTLSSQGFTTQQTLAGAIGTATHGSGHTGTLSDLVVALELVDAYGNVHAINADSPAHWLAAARVHLGALGFIYSVTLQCEQLFVLTHQRSLLSWNTCAQQYINFYNQTDYCMFMGLAHAPTVLYYQWHKTDKPISSQVLTQLKDRIVLSTVVSKCGLLLARHTPSLANKLISWSFMFMQQKAYEQYSYKILSPLAYPTFMYLYEEAEYGICFTDFAAALEQTRALCMQYKNIVSIITCRFSPGCTVSYLGQNYKRDTAYISVTLLTLTETIHEFYQAFAHLMSTYNGRPHWGKRNTLTKEQLIHLYGESIDAFNTVRKELDPTGIFANDFIKRCFD